MARWTASGKWAAGPALDGQRDMPLALRLSEWLGVTRVDKKDVQTLSCFLQASAVSRSTVAA